MWNANTHEDCFTWSAVTGRESAVAVTVLSRVVRQSLKFIQPGQKPGFFLAIRNEKLPAQSADCH